MLNHSLKALSFVGIAFIIALAPQQSSAMKTERVHSEMGAGSGCGPSLVKGSCHSSRPQDNHAVEIGA